MVTQDSWLIYENTGLLELHEPGFQDFTVTGDQYSNPILDKRGVLIQFEITQGAFEQVIKEHGILVGEAGLNIDNTVGASKIIFRSENEDGILLLGKVRVYNNPAQLSFIGPYIYCNACDFSGASLVTFSADKVTIASGGLLSSADLNILASTVNATGTIDIANLEAKVNGTFSFKELCSKGDVVVFGDKIEAGIVKVMGSARLQGNLSMTIEALIKTNLALELLSNGNITVSKSGVVESLASIVINSQNLSVQGKLHTKIAVNMTLIDNLILHPGSRLFSQGTLFIEGPIHETIKLLQINSSKVEVVGNANIKTDYLYLQRDGYYDISKQDIPIAASYIPHCRHTRGHYDVTCYKEVLTKDNRGASPSLLVGGNLSFAGKKIYNEFGVFKVAGAKTYLGPDPDISNKKMELRIVANFTITNMGTKKGHHIWSANNMMGMISGACGIATSIAAHTNNRKDSGEEVYYTENSVTTMEHSKEALNEIGTADIEEVSIAERGQTEHFIDQSTTAFTTSQFYTGGTL